MSGNQTRYDDSAGAAVKIGVNELELRCESGTVDNLAVSPSAGDDSRATPESGREESHNHSRPQADDRVHSRDEGEADGFGNHRKGDCGAGEDLSFRGCKLVGVLGEQFLGVPGEVLEASVFCEIARFGLRQQSEAFRGLKNLL